MMLSEGVYKMKSMWFYIARR